MQTRHKGHIIGSLLLGATLVGAAGAAEYSLDFRHDGFDNNRLRLIGPNAPTLLKPSPDGLLVALPAGTPGDEVGFAPRFRLSGDFQITLDYKIAELGQPKSGYGVGPSIYVRTDSKDRQAATLGRVLRVKEGHVHTAHQARAAGTDGKRRQDARFFNTEALEGKLRLERTGDRLKYSVAEDDGQFRTLHETGFTTADVTLARIALLRNGAGAQIPAAVVVRHVEIRADRFRAGDGGSWAAWLALALLGGLAAAGVWMARRRKAGAR